MRLAFATSLFLSLATAITVIAQDPPLAEPKSADIRQSIAAFSGAMQLAKKSWEVGVSDVSDEFTAQAGKLRDEHIAALEGFLMETIRSADLDESLKVRAIIQSLKDSKIEKPDPKVQVESAKKKIRELEAQIDTLNRSKAERLDRRNRASLAGTWRWFDGNDTNFAGNGEASHAGGALKGKWRLVDANKASFLVDWSGRSTDAVSILEGGILLEGRSSVDGKRIWAVRLK